MCREELNFHMRSYNFSVKKTQKINKYFHRFF